MALNVPSRHTTYIYSYMVFHKQTLSSAQSYKLVRQKRGRESRHWCWIEWSVNCKWSYREMPSVGISSIYSGYSVAAGVTGKFFIILQSHLLHYSSFNMQDWSLICFFFSFFLGLKDCTSNLFSLFWSCLNCFNWRRVTWLLLFFVAKNMQWGKKSWKFLLRRIFSMQSSGSSINCFLEFLTNYMFHFLSMVKNCSNIEKFTWIPIW